MILPFKQYFPWHTEKNPAPTYFREKILCGAGYAVGQDDDTKKEWIYKPKDYALEFIKKVANITPKLHTIRAGNRWKAGDKIHMAYGSRTKNYQQFNKGIPELQIVKSVQSIKIKITEFEFQGKPMVLPHIFIDDKDMIQKTDVIAANDGFSSVAEFGTWFNVNFEGQIIHWTDLRY